jgi:hypothetical protein
MMLACAAFWLLLCLPGYALLRRFSPAALEAGLLGNITLSYLASFALLTPVSVVGYVFHLPLAVLSSAYVLALAGAVFELFRFRTRPAWPFRVPRPSIVAVLVSALVVTDLVMGVRAGTYFHGDSHYHAARVRMLLSFGFNNWDPMVSGHVFGPFYHTSLYHALIATCAQLTRTEPIAAWIFALFFAKLATAGSIYYLAFSVLGQRWLAWSAAGTFVLYMAPSTVLAYPNTLAVYCVLPLALAFGAQLFAGEGGLRPVAGLAATSLMLVQVHALYFVFTVMLVAPAILLRLVVLQVRRLPGRGTALAALFSLALGAPWLGVTVLERDRPAASPAAKSATQTPPAPTVTAPVTAEIAHDWRANGFVFLDHGRLMLDPTGFWAPTSTSAQLLFIFVLGFFSRRRWHVGAIAIAIAVIFAALYVPQICTPLVHAAKAPWVLRRLGTVITAVHLALFPGALLLPLVNRVSGAWLQIVALTAGLSHAYLFGVDSRPWTRAGYLAQARKTARLEGSLGWHQKRHEFFRNNLPLGAAVILPLRKPTEFDDFIQDCDCFPLAPPTKRGSRGVADMDQRRVDLALLLGEPESLQSRLAILRRYQIRHLVLLRQDAVQARVERIYQPATVKTAKLGKMEILTLDLGK